MYELSREAASLADLIFGFVGIWMAHRLYRTPRRWWQAVLTWAAIYAFLICCTTPFSDLMPDMSYERASMVLGFCGIFAYLYLFPQIPISQRIFTYFLVDTSQTLLVLLGRVVSTLLAQWTGASVSVVFLCVYLPLTAAFIVLFRRWMRDTILASLKAFRTQLTSLAIFAAVCYITLLLQVPTWEAWPRLSFWTAGGALGMVAFVIMGYMLAFRTLRSLLDQEGAENSARQLAAQLSLSEKYYETLLDRLEQSHIRDHDLRHHVNTLSGLCAAGQWEELSRYVEAMGRDVPAPAQRSYCENGAVSALLGHYDALCAQEGIAFRCQVRLSDLGNIQPLHVCVIMGNALQNAMEAARALPRGAQRSISVRAVTADGRLVMSITNPFSGDVQLGGDGLPRSSKTEPGHGLGLESIRASVRRYSGWCGINTDGGEFTLSVTLPLS